MEKEVSCINSKAILDYMKAHYDGDNSELLKNLDPEIDLQDDPEGFLRDPRNWISCTVAGKLYARAGSLLEDNMAAVRIAQYAIENTSLGYAHRILVKAFGSMKKALHNLQKLNDKWNRNKRVEVLEVRRNEAIVRLHWNSHMDISKDFCLMNIGTYTYLPTVWGGSPISVEETCCQFSGAPYCEYHLKWPVRNRVHELLSRVFTSKSVLRETIAEMEEDKKIVEEKYEEVNRLNIDLNQKIKQLLAIQETGKAILSVLNLSQLLTVIMNLLSSVCRINRAVIMLVNDNEKCLEYIYGVGFGGETPQEVKNYKVPLDRVSNILVRVTKAGKPEYVPKVKGSSLRKGNIMLAYGQPTSVFVVPLITRSKVIGVLATDAVEGEGVPAETRETLEIFAPQIAIAIENARLYSRLQDQMVELKQSHALLSRMEKFSFLGNLAAGLAHEIKNPMTAIQTFIQMLPQKFNDEKFRTDFYQIAKEETGRINNLMTELLDLVKTRESHMAPDDLHSLIDKMILLISPQSKGKKLEVVRRFDQSIEEVWLDSEKMKQVILNLLANAVEFTPAGGKIEISTQGTTTGGSPGKIRIEIKDSGIGISEDMIDNVFDPYFTTIHKSALHNGTGLGLFIAHQNMQDQGGTIEVKSKLNEGTAFILTLKADSAAKQQDINHGQESAA